MISIQPQGYLLLVALVMCWSLAVVLYRVSMPGSVARMLSLLLVVEGVTLASDTSLAFFIRSPEERFPWYPQFLAAEGVVHTLGDCGMLALYPPFIAAALQTRLTRPFAGQPARIALAGLAALLFAIFMLTPIRFGGTLLYAFIALNFWFALISSIDAWRRSAGEARERARAFAVAFGIRDLAWSYAYCWAIWAVWQGTYSVVDEPGGYGYTIYVLGTLLAVPLIAYGILRTHLFDIDLRIRWTIRQSTLAAMIAAIVYAMSEGASRLLSSELGSAAGLLAAALVVFFLAPLQRFAERVASAAMPNTHNTAEYAAFRKLQVYEAAVAEARQGGLGDKERALLNRLRDSLGISPHDANTIELELQARG